MAAMAPPRASNVASSQACSGRLRRQGSSQSMGRIAMACDMTELSLDVLNLVTANDSLQSTFSGCEPALALKGCAQVSDTGVVGPPRQGM